MTSELTKEYQRFLRFEKSLSRNTVEAYMSDLSKLESFIEKKEITLLDVSPTDLEQFMGELYATDVETRTQARVLSGIKSFYRYLIMADIIDEDPTRLLDSPKIGLKLPDVLSVNEIDELIGAIDLSKAEGSRNRAILETLYSCGLRVSELVDLKISNLFFDDENQFIKVTGKGEKQRLVPIGRRAIKEIHNYLLERNNLNIQAGEDDYLFLNRRGKHLTRVMIFTIIKQLAERISLQKTISPHTFRHSFATHLVEGGANLRAVQEMLGHESITTTEVYTHLDRSFLRDTILEFHPRY